MNNIQDVLLSRFRQNFQINQDDFLSLSSKAKPDILESLASSLKLEIWEFFLIIIAIVFLVCTLIVIFHKCCRSKTIEDPGQMISQSSGSRPLFLRGYFPENM
jgi:hypothetical protein